MHNISAANRRQVPTNTHMARNANVRPQLRRHQVRRKGVAGSSGGWCANNLCCSGKVQHQRWLFYRKAWEAGAQLGRYNRPTRCPEYEATREAER